MSVRSLHLNGGSSRGPVSRFCPSDSTRRLLLLQAAECGESVTGTCRGFGVSRRAYYRWRARYRSHGAAGLVDRSSRPHHSARRLGVDHECAIAELRRQHGWGPDRIAAVLGLSRATVHRTIRRLGLQRQRPPREPVFRYQREHAGELLHVDTKKLGNLRRGIGHRLDHNREWRPSKMTPAGYVVLYAAVDDATRLAYTEYLRSRWIPKVSPQYAQPSTRPANRCG